MIVQNPVNREFFWTPHSQMFNILIPAVLFQLAQKDFILTRKRFWYYLLFFAAMTLVYPTFSIVIAVFFVMSWRKLGKIYGLFTFLVLLPRILWPRIVELLGGNYVDWPVVGHRRFVWIIDSYNRDTLRIDALNNLLKFLNSLPVNWLVITIGLMFFGALVLMQSRSHLDFSFNSDMMLATVALGTYSLGLLFNGEYGQRFSTGVVLLLTFLVMNELIQTKRPTKPILLAFFGVITLNCLNWVSW
jgi:hypothetical protein